MLIEKELIIKFVRQMLNQVKGNNLLDTANNITMLVALDGMVETSNFVGQPDIIKYIDTLIDNDNPYKEILLKRVYTQFASMPFFISICDIDEEGCCETDIIENSPKFKEISDYIDDLDIYSFVIDDYTDINKALEDDLEDMPDIIKFNLCILSDNKLRKMMVPHTNELLGNIKRKDLSSSDMFNIIRTLFTPEQGEEFKLEECLRSAFIEFFFLWTHKEYIYACAMLIVIESILEITYCENGFNKRLEALKNAIKEEKDNYNLNKIITKLYVDNSVEMEDIDTTLLTSITKELSTINFDGELDLNNETIYTLIHTYKILVGMRVSFFQKIEKLINNEKEEGSKITELRKEIKRLNKQNKQLSEQKDLASATIESLQKQISKSSKDKNNDYKAQMREISNYKNKIKQMEKAISKERDNTVELANLREFVYRQSLDIEYKDFNEKENKNFEELIKEKKILMFGGHVKMLDRLHNQYPDIDVLEIRDTKNFNEEIVKKYKLICINTNFLNHGAYYKLMNACDRYSVDYMYANNENIERIKRDIVDHLNSK